MKKRAKIITTIASLCLAVALLAFGVYAAANVTLNVTSQVNFVVTDVFASITGNVYKSADGTATGQEALTTQYSATTYTAGTPKTPMATVGGAGTLTWAIENGDVELTSAKPWVRYVIAVTNDEGKPINVSVVEGAGIGAYATASNNMTRGTLSYTTNESEPRNNSNSTGALLTCENLAVGKTVTFTYTAHVTNTAADVDDFEIDLDVSIVQYSA
ncbi:MAG: hypothetical protein J6T74_02415 [Clostridia bacterium]|nr:hypothetical protein [Clostridia bacterium]